MEDQIDDLRAPIKEILKGHDVTYAKNVKEAHEKFDGAYDLWLLDHDMEGVYEKTSHPNTGSAFLRWLLGDPGKEQKKLLPRPLPQVILHSQNTEGRKNMRKMLEDYGFKHVDECAYGPEYIKCLKAQL